MQLVEQLAIVLPFAVATVAIVIFAFPCFIFAFRASVGQLGQLMVDLLLELHLGCIKF